MGKIVLVGICFALLPLGLIIYFCSRGTNPMLKSLFVAKETVGRYGSVYEFSGTSDFLGQVVTGSKDVVLGELPDAGGKESVLTAIAFYEIGIPPGSTVLESRMRLEVDQPDFGPSKLSFTVESGLDPARLTNINKDVSSRIPVNYSQTPVPTEVEWESNAPWSTAHVFKYAPCHGEGTQNDRPSGCGDGPTSFNPLVQRVINQRGWLPKNDIVFLVKGTGTRRAQTSRNQALGPELQVRVYAPGVEVSPPLLMDLGIHSTFPDHEDWRQGAGDANARPPKPASQTWLRYLQHLLLCAVPGWQSYNTFAMCPLHPLYPPHSIKRLRYIRCIHHTSLSHRRLN